jgi:glycosyl transferase family 25
MLNILIINLKQSLERKESMLAQFENIKQDFQIIFIDAIDKDTLTEQAVSSFCDFSHSERRSLGEIACALSHRKAYKYIIENNLENAVILEDDIILSSDFKSVIKLIQEKTTKLSNYVIKLDKSNYFRYYCSFQNAFIVKSNNDKYKIKVPISRTTFAWGYFIDIEAARTLLTKYPKVSYVADEWNLFKKDINLFVIRPFIVDENTVFSTQSIIGDTRYSNKDQTKNNFIIQFINKALINSKYLLKTLLPYKKLLLK